MRDDGVAGLMGTCSLRDSPLTAPPVAQAVQMSSIVAPPLLVQALDHKILWLPP